MQITKQMVRSGMRERKLAIPWVENFYNTNNSELRQLLRDKKKFKQTCRRKKRESISKGMSNIDMQNSKETLRQIETESFT